MFRPVASLQWRLEGFIRGDVRITTAITSVIPFHKVLIMLNYPKISVPTELADPRAFQPAPG